MEIWNFIGIGEIRGIIATLIATFLIYIFKEMYRKIREKESFYFIKILFLITPIIIAYWILNFCYTYEEIPPKTFTMICFFLAGFLWWYFGIFFGKLDLLIKDSITKEEKENK